MRIAPSANLVCPVCGSHIGQKKRCRSYRQPAITEKEQAEQGRSVTTLRFLISKERGDE